MSSSRFPNNRIFALAIFDDTDEATEANVGPVYRLLGEIGILATKSVWPLANVPGAEIGGETLQEPGYLAFVRSLQADGFEIAFHNARNDSSLREITQRGLEEFATLLGHYPKTHCNHHDNRENLYWGGARLNRPLLRAAYNLATRFRWRGWFQGHLEGSPWFWGDLCRERIAYVRNFVFNEINLDLLNPTLPYHDPAKPYVSAWFSSSDGATAERFCHLLREENQDRLEAQGGVCIVYTHFAKGFCEDGRLHPEFERLMRRLARKRGWFVPVATLLEHLQAGAPPRPIPGGELRGLESRWLWQKLRRGSG